MQRGEAIALVQQLTDRVSRKDVSELVALYGDDPVAISPMFGEIHGRMALAASWTALFSMVPDLAIETSDVLVEGDRIAVLGTITATDRSGWFGLPPTGGQISY